MIEDPAIGYHQQDTNYYCGAACAQMVLDQIGAGILDQVGLYNDNHSHSTIEGGWASGPDGLTWTLNNREPSSFANYFVLFELMNEDLISRKIVWTIHHYQVAPVALVYGSQHWVVVRGFDASAAPSTYSDTSYTIDAFFLNNPWPPTPSPAPPPPHTGGDVCGSGGMRGIADEHVTYATWQSTYMTGVPSGHWSGKFVAVCDPEPPATWPGDRAPVRHRADGTEILPADAAVESVLEGLKQHGLYEHEGWGRILGEAEPGRPELVQRLDRLDDYYYIVPMGRGGERVTAAAAVDARFGDYQQAVALPEAAESLLASLEEDRAIDTVLDRKIELPALRGELVVRPKMLCVYPTLVWKPCRESLSPFYPFRMITVGSEHLYIRSDGAVFTELHDQDRGI